MDAEVEPDGPAVFVAVVGGGLILLTIPSISQKATV
jgi:hypothetical protein